MKHLLEFNITETGCKVPVNHKLNKDGYFRKHINGKAQMYHRYTWELVNGTIPNGYEVNHLCKNRACCNIEHLELLLRSEHRTKDNTGRNKDRKDAAKDYWLKNQCTGVMLGEIFGVTFSTGCRWIREFKLNRK